MCKNVFFTPHPPLPLKAGFWSTSTLPALQLCQLHGDVLIQCQISQDTTLQCSGLEKGLLVKANCCIQSETHYGFIVDYLSHNGSYCMSNKEISLMLQIRFCKPTLLYQNMVLSLMPDVDFRLYLIPLPFLK